MRRIATVALLLTLVGCRPVAVENPRCQRLAGFKRLTIGSSIFFGITAVLATAQYLDEQEDLDAVVVTGLSAIALGLLANSICDSTDRCIRKEQETRAAMDQLSSAAQEREVCRAMIAAWQSERSPLLRRAFYDEMTPECRQSMTEHADDESHDE